jgi:hypothetical protein
MHLEIASKMCFLRRLTAQNSDTNHAQRCFTSLIRRKPGALNMLSPLAIKPFLIILTSNSLLSSTEPLPTCAARVDALRSHGLVSSALRLTVAVVRTMKQQQLLAQRRWHESQQALAKSATSSQNSASSHSNSATSGGSGNNVVACTSRCRSSHCYEYYR